MISGERSGLGEECHGMTRGLVIHPAVGIHGLSFGGLESPSDVTGRCGRILEFEVWPLALRHISGTLINPAVAVSRLTGRTE